MANTVTIKIKPETKALMDRYASTFLARKGKALTNDDVITELVKTAAPRVYEQIQAEIEEEKIATDDKEK